MVVVHPLLGNICDACECVYFFSFLKVNVDEVIGKKYSVSILFQEECSTFVDKSRIVLVQRE